MKLKVLGCSGGIGGHLRTTSMLVDHDLLIDAGTGLSELSIEELKRIDHIFLTHSHLDHVGFIPFLVDTVGCMRDKPITLHATRATLQIIRQHLFNWKIWPDFTQIPGPENPYLVYRNFVIGETIDMGGRKITPIPANHVVPAVGFHLDSGRSSLVFTGDTTTNPELWEVVNKIENLNHHIIETAFCNREKALAIKSKHLCPSMLAEELKKWKRPTEIFITHLKPGEGEITMKEIEECIGEYHPKMLQQNQIIEF